MTPPRYEMISQRYDPAHVVHGVSCQMGDIVVDRCGDISTSAGVVGKMVELFNLCELPPERMRNVIAELLP